MRAILAMLLLAYAPSTRAAEYVDGPHWVVVIEACRDDNAQSCQKVRQPFDADNEIGCAMRGWMAATKWAVEHKGWHLKGQSCAPASEKDI